MKSKHGPRRQTLSTYIQRDEELCPPVPPGHLVHDEAQRPALHPALDTLGDKGDVETLRKVERGAEVDRQRSIVNSITCG